MKISPPAWSAALGMLTTLSSLQGAALLQLKSDGLTHLGQPGHPEYEWFAHPPAVSPSLTLTFTAQANPAEQSLFLRQDDVKETWTVELNGNRLGALFAIEQSQVHGLPIPPGSLRDGSNELRILPPSKADDILIGDVFIDPRPLALAVTGGKVTVRVLEAGSQAALPCRLTIIDDQGSLAPLRADPGQHLAVRPGVVYTPDGQATLHLRPGNYTLHASRGFEYGLSRQSFHLAEGDALCLNLSLAREVNTEGWISCDPHTHTFTFSRHGDATLDERIVTLAGEHIELPVATDHNILTDYAEAARRLGVHAHFTPVMGDEVTTRQAHFNVFPVEPGSRVPDFRIADWPKLMQNIRATPGVQVAILNHPLNVHNGFQPFAPTNFNSMTGEILQTLHVGFDALELINSSAQQSDMMAVYRGWFALLNAGHRITGLGSSDGHDVSRYIIGQGRTYLQADDRNPGRIDIDQACRSLKEGRALVSMGLWVNLRVQGRFGPGDLTSGLHTNLRVEVEVAGPSWITADAVELYANGQRILHRAIPPSTAAGLKTNLALNLPWPAHDVHLVALATGPGVSAPFWVIPRPYQPNSPQWIPRVAGSTNPVWVDADGDGVFTSAADYARKLVTAHGTQPEALLPALAPHDTAVAAQAAALCRKAGLDFTEEAFQKALRQSPPAVQAGFAN